jgi:hypothetical protein
MALGSVGALWLTQSQRLWKAGISALLAAALIVPAGLHAARNLHFFAPFGNLYFNSIYHDSGQRNIAVDYGPLGRFQFGAPSFYTPTYFPFSGWLTDRTGTVAITINTRNGEADWKREQQRIRALRQFPAWRQRWEDLQYLLFGEVWPNSDDTSFIGTASLWGRWLWPPLLLFLLYAVVKRWFVGVAWLLPAGGLGTVALLALQTQAVTEGRFREPIDGVLMASTVCAIYFGSRAAKLRRRELVPLPQVQQ